MNDARTRRSSAASGASVGSARAMAASAACHSTPLRPDERPRADDLPLRHEDPASRTFALAGHHDAHGHLPELLHAPDLPRRFLERRIRSRRRAASSKRRSRASRRSFSRSFGSASSNVSHSTPCSAREASCARAPARQWAELVGLRRADDAVAAATEIEVAIRTHRPRVRRRAQLANQAQLLERRLELRAARAPFDSLESSEGRLDRGPLALRAKVRAQPCMEVARAPDVEHLVVRVAKEVHARSLRRTERQAPLALDAARLGRRQLDQVCDGARAALLRHPDQAEQDLRRRLGVGQRTVAGTRVGREPVRQCREIRRLASEQPTREPDRVDDRAPRPACRSAASSRCRETPCRSARCARRARRRRRRPRKRRHRRGDGRTHAAARASRRPVSAEIAGSSLTPGLASVSKRAVSSSRATRTAPNSQGRGDAGPQAGRLEVEDDEGRLLERSSSPGASARRDQVTRPAEPARRRGLPRRAANARGRRGRALPSFRTARAASSAATGPRCSSTSSTSRSAASRRSCTPGC